MMDQPVHAVASAREKREPRQENLKRLQKPTPMIWKRRPVK